MKKIFIVLFCLFLVAPLVAQQRIVENIPFEYENGNRWNHATGDSLAGGLAAGADTTDTIYFSAGKGGRLYDQILVAVKKDTTLSANDKTDTTLVFIYRGVGGFYTDLPDTATGGVAVALNGGVYVATDILGFYTDEFVFEIDGTAGNFSATNYKMTLDNSKMASSTDSTAYRLRIYGIYQSDR